MALTVRKIIEIRVVAIVKNSDMLNRIDDEVTPHPKKPFRVNFSMQRLHNTTYEEVLQVPNTENSGGTLKGNMFRDFTQDKG